ncbi:MAG: crosslink repair DNA glycosylase YcaQ family protein [bacterium]|nr:crosslink repair DNA glycosylase YcaQ family protein [bacterium]
MAVQEGMLMNTLSQDAVRGLMIAAQGLDDELRPPATKDDVLATVRQLHLLQIDSISVVARAPYFVLWSRLGDYLPRWLDELLEEGALFEHFASGNCFIPIEDFRLFLAGSRIFDWRDPRTWLDEHPQLRDYVLNHIREQGETRHTDFKRTDGMKTTWENPKEEQIVLDYLVYVGEVMIRRRDNFQRVYDLRERIFPDADKLPAVSREEAHDQFVLNTIKVLGVAKAEWIPNYYRLKKGDVNAALKRLEKAERVLRVKVEGWKSPGYFHPDHLRSVEAAANGQIPHSKTTLLSPFDPLVWDRQRGVDLFDFDFPIEFYFPAHKRKYGYYSLPILHDNRLIGRLDPKAQRYEGLFEVKSLHLEPGVEVDDALVMKLRRVLGACAVWHQTPQVVVREASEPDLAEMLSD